MNALCSHPWALALLAPLGLLAVLMLWSERQKRRSMEAFTQTGIRVRSSTRIASSALLIAGLLLLIVGIAGPRWGVASEPTLGGRDVVVVLDLSRSMLAEQPSRQELAQRLLRDLGEAVKRRGGHRLGLIAFAAHPRLVVPLTRDYDHFMEAVSKIDAVRPPRELAASLKTTIASGTRFGMALRLAIDIHDADRKEGQHILLVSDGDDPARDEEWREGADTARQRNIRVHTVGVGDPSVKARIPLQNAVDARDGWLWFENDFVHTALQEDVLGAIAQRTAGEYLAAHTKPFPLGATFRQILERAPGDDLAVAERESPSQHTWFLCGALVCFCLSLGVEKLPRRVFHGRLAPVGLGLAVLCVIAADSQIDDLLRRGSEAFEAGKYELALKHFTEAEVRTTDPGLVAFNKAATLYRLGLFREAQLHYQRCLEDDQIPSLRKARAYYDLGNCLVRRSAGLDRRILGEAIRAYELCVGEESSDALKADAQHNLEIARLLWRAAPPASENAGGTDSKATDPLQKKQPDGVDKENGKGGKLIDGPGGEKTGKHGAGSKDAIPGGGTSPSLPDSDQAVRLTMDDTLWLLADAVRRIQNDQRSATRQSAEAGKVLKNW